MTEETSFDIMRDYIRSIRKGVEKLAHDDDPHKKQVRQRIAMGVDRRLTLLCDEIRTVELLSEQD